MTSRTQERRPTEGEAASIPGHGNGSQSSAPTLAVVVRRQLAGGGTRTTIYRTIAPAEKALDRAAKAGLRAVVEFVRLVPVEAPTPAELAALQEVDGR